MSFMQCNEIEIKDNKCNDGAKTRLFFVFYPFFSFLAFFFFLNSSIVKKKLASTTEMSDRLLGHRKEGLNGQEDGLIWNGRTLGLTVIGTVTGKMKSYRI